MKRIACLLAILAACVSAQTLGPNLVKNSSFEEGVDDKGVPKGWRIEKSDGTESYCELVKENATDGQWCVHLVKPDTRGAIYIAQTLVLKPNTEYEMEVKGKRDAGYRWHHIGARQPDTQNKVNVDCKLSDGIPCKVRFTTHPKAKWTYISAGLWGYTKEDNPATKGQLWVDEITVREVQNPPLIISQVPHYFFTSDTVSGQLFSQNLEGQGVFSLVKPDGAEVFRTELPVVKGKNAFAFDIAELQPGNYALTIKVGEAVVEQNILLETRP